MKPGSEQAITIDLGFDQKTRIDLSAVANEKMTMVHVGTKLIVLFDNHSTVTIEPFFDSTGKPLANLDVDLGAGRDVTGDQFASLFPITEDQSVLPAAGGAGAPASGADFHSASIDLLSSGTPLALLGQESLGTWQSIAPLGAPTQQDLGPTVSGSYGSVLILEADLDKTQDGSDLAAALTTGTDPGGTRETAVLSGVTFTAGSQPIDVTFGNTSGVTVTEGGNAIHVFWVASPDGAHLDGYLVDPSTPGAKPAIELQLIDPATNSNHVGANGTINPVVTVTLTDAFPHSANGHDVIVINGVPVVATDSAVGSNGLRQSATTTLEIDIVDDTPVSTGAHTAATTLDDDGFAHGNPQGTGDVSDANEAKGGEGALFDAGADGLKSVTLTSTTEFKAIYVDSNGVAHQKDVTHDAGVVNPDGSATWTFTANDIGTVATLTIGADGSYDFKTDAPLVHPASGASEENLPLTFNYTVTDGDGDTAPGSLTVNINDDTPVLSLTQAPVYHADEGDIITPRSVGTSPDDGQADGSTTGPFDIAGPATVTGSVLDAVSFGADGEGGFSFTSGALSTLQNLWLTSNGGTLHYAMVGDTLVAYVNGVFGNSGYQPGLDRTVFTLSLDHTSGDFEFRLYDQLDHVDDGLNAKNTDLQGAHGIISGLDFGSLIVATDGDGDAVTLDGKLTIEITDDIPKIIAFGETGATLTVDETANRQANDTTPGLIAPKFNDVAHVGHDPDMAAQYAFNLAPVVASAYLSGADDSAHVVLSLTINGTPGQGEPGVDSGLTTTEGATIYLVMENGLIVGRIDGNNDGKFDGSADDVAAFAISINQFGQISVAQYLSIHNKVAGDDNDTMTLGGTISAHLMVTDHDGDTVAQSVVIGTDIHFNDDGPSAGNYTGGNYAEGGSPQIIGAAMDVLHINPGADGLATGGLQSIAFSAGSHGGSLSIDNNGNLVYAPPADVMSSATVTETFTYTVTDGDNDTVTRTITFGVTDIGVSNVTVSNNAVVDEDDLAIGNHDNAPGDKDQVTTGQISYTLGPDGLQSVELSADTSGITKLDGTAIHTIWDAASQTLIGYGGSVVTDVADVADKIFTIVITDATNSGADYEVTLLQPILHPGHSSDPSDTASTPTSFEDDKSFTVTVTVTDNDGSEGTATFTVGVNDDSPVILSPDDSSATEVGLTPTTPSTAHGSLGVDFGADGAAPSAASGTGGIQHTINFDDAHNGTLPANTYSHDGFSFHTDQGIANVTDHAGQMYGTVIDVSNGGQPFTITQMDLGLYGQSTGVPADNVRLTGVDAVTGQTIIVIFNVGTTISLGEDATTFYAAGTAFDGVSLSSLKIESIAGWQGSYIFNGSVVVDNVMLNSGSAPLTHGAVSFTDLTTAANNVAIDDGTVTTLKSHGEDVKYVLLDAVTLVGYTGDQVPTAVDGANVVFSVVLSQDAGNPHGAYDFTLRQPLDDLPSSASDLKLTFNFTATDGDGDATSSHFTVDVADDIPHPVIAATDVTLSIDETAGDQSGTGDFLGAGNTPIPAVFAGVTSSYGAPIEIAHSSGAVVSSSGYGADGAGATPPAYALVVASGGIDSGLTATDGHKIFLYEENGLVIGRESVSGDPESDGAIAFAISLDSATGVVTVAEYTAIHQGNTNDANDFASIIDGALQATVTLTDFDGDQVTSAPVSIGGQIKFLDDGPSIAQTPVMAVVDEDGLRTTAGDAVNGNHDSRPGDVTVPDDDRPNGTGDGNEATATGRLNINWGADNYDGADTYSDTGGFTQDGAGRSVTFTDNQVGITGGTLSSHGDDIVFSLENNGTRLVGTATHGGVERTVIEMTLSDDGTGAFHVILHDALDQTAGNDENDIVLTFNYTATDSDGDHVAGTFGVTVNDDVPVFTGQTATGSVNEADMSSATTVTSPPILLDFSSTGLGATHLHASGGDGGVTGVLVVTDATTGNSNLQGPDTGTGAKDLVLTAETGTTFTLNSIAIGWFGSPYSPAPLTIIAYDADGHKVAEIPFTADVVGYVSAPIPGDSIFSGFGNIQISKLVIQAPDGYAGRVVIDNLAITETTTATTSTPHAVETVVDLTPLVSMGADSPGTWSIAPFVEQQLHFTQGTSVDPATYNGKPIMISISPTDSHTIIGMAEGVEIFTMTVSSDGHATFDLFQPIDGGTLRSIDFSQFVTVTDSDGDPLKLVDGDFIIDISSTDHLPTVSAIDSVSVYEAGLPARSGEPAGSHEGAGDKPVTAAGTIAFTSVDGVSAVSLGGHDLSASSATPTVITDATGTMSAYYTYDAATGNGLIHYSYTLPDNTLTDPSAANFDIVVTDADHQASAPKTLTVNIVDDAPSAQGDTDTVTTGLQTLTFDDIPLAKGQEGPISHYLNYGGFIFQQTGVYDPSNDGSYFPTSGDNLAFIGEKAGTNIDGYAGNPGDPIVISKANHELFAPQSLNLSSNSVDPLTVVIVGYKDGNVIGTISVNDVHRGSATLVNLSSLGLVDHIALDSPDGANNLYFGFDDFSYTDVHGSTTGNVITGIGTTSAGGADVLGADGAHVTAASFGDTTVSMADADANGNLTIHGTYGTLTINTDGTYTYTRDAGSGGGHSDVFTYTLTDGDNDPSMATLTIGIDNSAPTIGTIPAAGDEHAIVYEAGLAARNGDEPAGSDGGKSVTAGGTIAFTSLDGVSAVTLGGHVLTTSSTTFDDGSGTMSAYYTYDAATGSGLIHYEYTLTDNTLADPSSASFDIVVTDADHQTSTPTTLTVNIVDDAPVANNDTAATDKNQAVTVDVKANDVTGADGVDWSIPTNVTHTDAAHGTVIYNDNGTFTYTPTANYVGDDSFTYTIKDGDGDPSTATVTLTVNNTGPLGPSVYDNHIIANAYDYTGNSFAISIPIAGLLWNIHSADGSVSLVPGSVSNATVNGNNIVFNVVGGSGSQTSFTYDVTDGTNVTHETAYVTRYNDAMNNHVSDGNEILINRPNDSVTDVTSLGGNDVIVGGNGSRNNILSGGEGDDLIFGATGTNNTLHGNNGNDVLYGGNGQDNYLFGDAGNDTLYTGFSGTNHLVGGSGSDTLYVTPGATSVTLTGGDVGVPDTDSDHFVFMARSNGTVVHITDFTSGTDSIDVLLSAFAGLSGTGSITSNQFINSNNPSGDVVGSDVRFIYQQSSGHLYYDSDGGSTANRVLLATLDNHAVVQATDIHKV
ncbi:DUF5801 repeats-in-toxin domain-containing protein [Afipia felis]